MADSAAAHAVLMWRPRPRQLIALDCLAAVALTVLFVTLSQASNVALGIAVAAGMGLPVSVRRVWPVPVFGVVAVASVLASLLGVVREPFLSAAFALYWVAVTTPGIRWVPAARIGLASIVVLLAGMLVGSPAVGVVVHLMGLALIGMAWTVGRAVHERRAYAARLMRQATSQAVAEERLRIARELHDIVAHNIGVIAVKAGVANHVLPVRPQEAGEALQAIETASRAALAEMRHMLGVLRSGDTPSQATEAALGLSGLPELVEQAAEAGVTVALHTRNLDGLPEGVDRSAYRIVQEALTNVMKHAAPTQCRVAVEAAGRELVIDIADDGTGTGTDTPRSSTSNGHGLIGMRERVALYHGELRAGPQPDGGFAVQARLPLWGPR